MARVLGIVTTSIILCYAYSDLLDLCSTATSLHRARVILQSWAIIGRSTTTASNKDQASGSGREASAVEWALSWLPVGVR
jgi:hypothetical protein